MSVWVWTLCWVFMYKQLNSLGLDCWWVAVREGKSSLQYISISFSNKVEYICWPLDILGYLSPTYPSSSFGIIWGKGEYIRLQMYIFRNVSVDFSDCKNPNLKDTGFFLSPTLYSLAGNQCHYTFSGKSKSRKQAKQKFIKWTEWIHR